MATSAHRLIQDQNLNSLYNGSTPAGKSDVAKADKKRDLARRKALDDISNSRNPLVLSLWKKKTSTRVISIEEYLHAVKAKSSKAFKNGKVGGRKALNDLTNSVKPPSKPVPSTGQKFNAVVKENIPCSHADEICLHNHEKCIKAQTEALNLDTLCWTARLINGITLPQLSAKQALQLSPNKHENKMMKHLEIEDMPECTFEYLPELRGYSSSSYPSPKSPEFLFMKWDEKDIFYIRLTKTP